MKCCKRELAEVAIIIIACPVEGVSGDIRKEKSSSIYKLTL